MNEPILFSICHTSARPDRWFSIYRDWMSKAVNPERVEYVLCIDARWGFSLETSVYVSMIEAYPHIQPGKFTLVQNTGRKCYVDGVNIAAAASSGSILIVNADDQFACEQWDKKLLDVAVWAGAAIAGPFVIEPDCGGHESERGIMPMPILSRARYEQQGGFVFYPEYESMYADNDFCEWARKDGVVLDGRHLYFHHDHPMYKDWKGTGSDERWDAAYMAQNRPEASAAGRAIFERRRASGFGSVTRRLLALCLPGEHFEGPYLDMILDLQAHILLNHPELEPVRLRAYTSNPYITREDIRRAMENEPRKPDLCLWIDDDNVLTVEHFERLLFDLESHPEVDGVSAWCWIHNENKQGFMVSCGNWSPDGLHWDPFPASFAHGHKLEPFETGGFPCILMRYSALEKAQAGALSVNRGGAFLPIIDNRLPHGMSGEDLAFFKHAQIGGAKFLVNPRLRVPHLKYVTVEPVLSDEGKVPVKVACMMRVRNEARWIRNTIESVKELCGADIYVMEDGSTDDTRAIAEAAGAVVLDSPFLGMGLDEARDKDWLLHEVISRCKPDWILCPDGDEELEPGGCAKIRRALETNPDCDCFALGFLYFWGAIDQIRTDGVYGKLRRQSLFRADETFRFKSYYAESDTPNQNHVGLHTSNAPGLGGQVMVLRVNLYHYGYLHKEDRIQKYRWIVSIDPHNEGEDFYRHCVQGDLPEFPADAQYKHGGPLTLQQVPARMVPKFPGGVPGPRAPVESWGTPLHGELVSGD